MNPCTKVVCQLNIKKIGDYGMTLSISQETIKNLPKASIPPPTKPLCLPLNQMIFEKSF